MPRSAIQKRIVLLATAAIVATILFSVSCGTVAAPKLSRSLPINSRRTAITTLIGLSSLGAARGALAIKTPDINDHRYSKPAFDRFNQAADTTEDIRLRQGITQARGSLDQTKARLVAAGKKIDEAGAFMKKGAWEDGRGVLRRSAGTMRFDLRTVATSKSGQGRTEALRKTQQFLSDLDRFDNAMRLKDKPAAEEAYQRVKEAYQAVIV
mmetsp:Transcript_1657/g.2385  ORF Transcript_1657/g.2385 Transcript_1657/m.2385 type:complete len:210 (+) Transcript_1657:94-723(+)